jgi:hypothetical protein
MVVADADLPRAEAASRASAAAAPTDSFRFIFEDQRLYVPVRVEGGAERWFILDTGATPTLVDAAVARAAGLAEHGEDVTTGAGGGQSRVAQTRRTALTVGHTRLAVDSPIVADVAGLLGPTSGRAPAGIVGSQFFREHVVVIDFHKRIIALYPPRTDLSRSFDQSVPLTFADDTPLTKVWLTLPSGRKLAARALVDLGAKSTFLIPEPFIDRQHLRAAFPHSVTTGLGAGMGGDTHYAFARAPRLELRPSSPAMGLSNPVVGLSVGGTLRSTWHEGLLGAEFLSHFRLGFDYAASRLLLTRADRDQPQFDRSGLFVAGDRNDLSRLFVREVVKDSPGAAAGLQPGDEILKVDGAAAAALGLPALRNRLKSPTQPRVRLTYRRGGEQRDVTLRLQALL